MFRFVLLMDTVDKEFKNQKYNTSMCVHNN